MYPELKSFRNVLILLAAAGAVPAGAEPVVADEQESAREQQQTAIEAGAVQDAGRGLEPVFSPLQMRVGGELGYDIRSDKTGSSTIMQQGETARLRVGAGSYLWQPWLAQLAGNLDFGFNRRNTRTEGLATSGGSSSADQTFNTLNGDVRLSVLQQSRFPFNAFYEKGDSRQSGNLGVADDYGFRRAGLTQSYQTEGGSNFFAGFDRNTQTSERSGVFHQDNLRLDMSRQFDGQHIDLSGNRNTNTREATGEWARFDLVSARHAYVPDATLSVESLANYTESDYRQARNLNDTRLTQLNSNAFWRSQERPLTVNGGIRLFALESDTDSGLGATTAELQSANANVGAYYEVDRNWRLNASANGNLSDSEVERIVTTSETVGATYQADAVALGDYRYDRTVSTNLSNRTGAGEGGQQLALQLSHGLNRDIALDDLGYLGMNLTQGGSIAKDTTLDVPKTLLHSAALTWSIPQGDGQTYLRLSASDTRAFGGAQDSTFQLVNFQLSSNQPLNNRSSFNGNLTIQSIRQHAPVQAGTGAATEGDGKFTTSSSADLNYLHLRAFGVPMLRFVSTLTLTGEAFLPVAGGPEDMAQKSWENRFDYSIGRTQFTLSERMSEVGEGERITSIWFTVKRQFGD